MDMNRVFLYGNLTRDPESRQTQNGTQVTSFTIAVNERRGQREETMYVKIETWQRTAELCSQYLQKGAAVLVEGRLKIEEYTTREGEKRRDPVVVADRVSFGPKAGGSGGGGQRGDYGGRDQQRSGSQRDPQRSAPRQDSFDDAPSPSGGVDDDLPF